MKKKHAMKKIVLPLFIFILLVSSCKKEEEDLDSPPGFAFGEIGEVDLDLINKSNYHEAFSVFVFQTNLADGKSGKAIAWRVFESVGVQAHHPFHFADWIEAGVNDDIGNYTPKLWVDHGSMYEAISDLTGLILHYHGESQCFNILSVVNHHTAIIDANIYRDGKRLGTKEVPIGAYGRFEFEHSLYFAVDESMSIQEGDEFPVNLFLDNATKFDLTGIESAEIVITGGPSPDYVFTLENIKHIPDER